jgi:hypothetical protein
VAGHYTTIDMNPELLQRIIALVKQHGERMVLMDQETGEGVVILDLASYEQLLAASENGDVQQPMMAPRGGFEPAPREMQTQAHQQVQMQPQPRQSLPQQQSMMAGQRFQQRPSYGSQHDSGRTRHIPSSLLTEAEVFAQVGEPLTKVVRKKPVTMRPADLTPQSRVGKINRDIGEWKSATTTVPQEPIEDEERFYLEPIE